MVLLLRLLFLSLAVGLMALVPVTVFRCGPDPAGAACRIEERVWLGRRLVDARSVQGIRDADAAPDGYSLRLLDDEGVPKVELRQSAVLGSSMVHLARRISATAKSGAGAPWMAWQWPLPVAAMAGGSLAFVAGGPLGWLWARRRTARRRAIAEGRLPGPELLDFAVPAVLFGFSTAIFAFMPVVVYRCAHASGGASCQIERRAAGLIALERQAVHGISSAEAGSEDQRTRDGLHGDRRERTLHATTIALLDAQGRVLFEDRQSSAFGFRPDAIADEIGRVARGEAAALVRWRAPWLGQALGGLVAAFGLLTLVSLMSRLWRR